MALTTYKLNPAATNTFDGNNFSGVTSFSIDNQGEENTLSADGNQFIQLAYMTNVSYIVTVNTMDISTDMRVGMCGSLVLNGVSITDCQSESSNGITYTFSKAQITNVVTTVNHTSQSELVVTFRCFDNTGADPLTVS